MDLYRRIAAVRTREEADDLLDEIVDRYGEPPQGVRNLIAVALLRAEAAACGVSEITQRQETLHFTLAALDFSAVSALCAEPSMRKRLVLAAGDTPVLSYRLQRSEDPLSAARDFLRQYRSMMQKGCQNFDNIS